VPELAAVLGVAVGTVRRWVRVGGIPLIDSERPKLINGGEFLIWYKAREQGRKVRCGPRQMYCCKCRDARDILPGSAIVIHRNEKSATVKALCVACGTTMNRHCSRQNAAEWAKLARPPKGHQPRLIASTNALVNDAFEAPYASETG
jgi:hypothetical protein